MSQSDDGFFSPAKDADVSRGVKNLVVVGLWLFPIGILAGVGIAVLVGLPVVVVRTAFTVDASALGGALAGADLSTPAVVVAIGIGGLYLVLARETFGAKDVEGAQEQISDAAEEAPIPDGGDEEK